MNFIKTYLTEILGIIGVIGLGLLLWFAAPQSKFKTVGGVGDLADETPQPVVTKAVDIPKAATTTTNVEVSKLNDDVLTIKTTVIAEQNTTVKLLRARSLSLQNQIVNLQAQILTAQQRKVAVDQQITAALNAGVKE